jgi:AraC-like DNA-binding protein
MHESPTKGWTVAQLAKEAALSRSTFFERFSRAVGVAPMEYLLPPTHYVRTHTESPRP